MPQRTGSSIPEPPSVLSNSVSLEDGDSVILINPEKKKRGLEQTHDAVILTANLIQDKPAPPAVQTGKIASEFTLAPASRFKQMPVNPWVLSERDALSTFALDVDTASYALCRQYIEHGYLPPAGAVR
ncbi:MAG: hypothetical protein GY809_26580, partial [Planctomycetes bacterium]|nr:hypothetical protein [Planctomycetota bacterium]